jgi:hypothetical protein
MVYNTFPWPKLERGVYPEYVSYTPISVRDSPIDLMTTHYDDESVEFSASQLMEKAVKALTPADKKKAAVEKKAQGVLDVRATYPLSTLADLYDPLTMPAELVKAHAELDRAVDRCYRSAPFTSDRQRIEFLFALYEHYTAPLLAPEKKKGR